MHVNANTEDKNGHAPCGNRSEDRGQKNGANAQRDVRAGRQPGLYQRLKEWNS